MVVIAAGVLLAGLLLPPALGLARVLAAAPAGSGTLPGLGQLPRASVVLDADGQPFARLYEQRRLPVAAGDIAPVMGQALVAIEDRRFFSHHGVDGRGIVRALVTNLVTAGSPLDGQGASTITMQYVKNLRLYAATTPQASAAAVTDTLARKLRDARDALALERRLSKREILTRYENTVAFGHGAYGVEAAARTYFDTTAARLTLPQAALLAGLVNAPSRLDPVDHPDAARTRRGLVLDAMRANGTITAGQAAAAAATGLGLVLPLRERGPGCVAADPDTGFFCRYILDYLGRHGVSAEALRTGGYTVATTLDRAATATAARAAAAAVPQATPGIADAVAVVEPGGRHRVRALAANRALCPDRAAGQTAYALPTEPVPFGAGSIFKIFTAAAALDRGVVDLDDTLPAPDRYTSRVFTDGGAPYTVTGNSGAPPAVTLRTALALSPNTTFVALLDRIGSVDPVVDMARRLGLRRSLDLPAGDGRTVGEAVRAEQRASFTLGPVIPLELANVAATIADHGRWCPPTPITAVTDAAGRRVPLDEAACEQAVPRRLADTLAYALSGDVEFGTASRAAAAAGWQRPAIGKTGTTQNNLSAGFVGATPRLATAVLTWSDGADPRPVCTGEPPRLCARGTLFGGTIPAATWFATMQPLVSGRLPLPLPAGTGPSRHVTTP